MRGAGSKPRLEKAGRPRVAARELCEEFAPRNGAARVRGERGANRASKKPAGPEWRRGQKIKREWIPPVRGIHSLYLLLFLFLRLFLRRFRVQVQIQIRLLMQQAD